jgi:hypothetical protein
MSVGFAFRFVPIRLALLSCAIYIALVVLTPRAFTFSAKAADGGMLVASRWGWTIINGVIFLGAFSLAWQLVMPHSK